MLLSAMCKADACLVKRGKFEQCVGNSVNSQKYASVVLKILKQLVLAVSENPHHRPRIFSSCVMHPCIVRKCLHDFGTFC